MDDKYNKYYYIVDVSLVDYTRNNVVNINDYFVGLRITYNYKKHVFPVVEIQLSLDGYLYNTIKKNDIKLKLSIVKKILDSNDFLTNTIKKENFLLNELFTIIDKTKLEYISENIDDIDIPTLDVKLTLFSDKHLKINKMMFNGNYLNCRTVDIISLINNVNQSNILIERPDNQRKYEQIIVPPMNCFSMIDYLQKYYTVYRNGIRTFFDFNDYYIISEKISNKTPINKNDYRNVQFNIMDDDEDKKFMPYDCGYKSETSDYYYIKTNDENINIINNNDVKEEIFGTKNIVLTRDSNLDIVREDINLEGNIDKTKLFYNNLESLYLENSFEKIYKRRALFKFTHLDIDTFKCNKLFLCKIDSKDYRFKIESSNITFIKDKNTGDCSMQGVCVFIEN